MSWGNLYPMDFTIKKYKTLIQAIKKSGYDTQTMAAFMGGPSPRVIVLRHDVDERPENAVQLAMAEHREGIKSTYYFRIVKISSNPDVIKKIAGLGHEIGYHYEDYAFCKGDPEKAINRFQRNLEYFRQFYPVKTVCMHGSSMSDFDNRDLWRHCSLKDFGLMGEPYLTIDYTDILYLTDTARTWNGNKYSIRDSVKKNDKKPLFFKTDDIIDRLKTGDMPEIIILQSHTLWTDDLSEWIWLELREFIRNRLKVVFQKSPMLKKHAFNLIQRHSNK